MRLSLSRLILAALLMAVLALLPLLALAGSPHFVSCALSSATDGTLCVSGKEAGLGDEAQITVSLTGAAHCQNPGGHTPHAQNKVSFVQDATVPAQNGKANYTVCATPDFQPDCSPPMTVVVESLVVFDGSNGISCPLD